MKQNRKDGPPKRFQRIEGRWVAKRLPPARSWVITSGLPTTRELSLVAVRIENPSATISKDRAIFHALAVCPCTSGHVTQKGLHPARFAAYLSRERSPFRTRPARVTSVADTGLALPGGSICLIVIIARSRQEGMYLTRTCYAEACDLSHIIDPEAKQQI
jgi:hypothetical protein